VATHSSGNHAAALSRAAKLRGIAAHIVMPSNSPKVKVRAVEGYGGRITFCEPNQRAREVACARVIAETGATLIHPFENEEVMAGQGTAALELMEDVPDLEGQQARRGEARLPCVEERLGQVAVLLVPEELHDHAGIDDQWSSRRDRNTSADMEKVLAALAYLFRSSRA